MHKKYFESDITIKKYQFQIRRRLCLKKLFISSKKDKPLHWWDSPKRKSTIANLLTRFMMNEGTISIDGTNIQDMNLQLRGLMGLVTQDSILFNDTIKANISLGKPDATDDEIIVALKLPMPMNS
jgi:subfamily B ATP-binding cassette protein MsbA